MLVTAYAGLALRAALNHVLGESLLEGKAAIGVGLHVVLFPPELLASREGLNFNATISGGDDHPLGVHTLTILGNEAVTLFYVSQVLTIGPLDRDGTEHNCKGGGNTLNLGLSVDHEGCCFTIFSKIPETGDFIFVLAELAFVENGVRIITAGRFGIFFDKLNLILFNSSCNDE